jgi:transcription initiation factor IIE alpha subunit
MKKTTRGNPTSDPVLLSAINELVKETEGVKRLLIVLLLKLGATSDEIAVALGVAPSAIRTAIPSRKIKRLPFTREADDRK